MLAADEDGAVTDGAEATGAGEAVIVMSAAEIVTAGTDCDVIDDDSGEGDGDSAAAAELAVSPLPLEVILASSSVNQQQARERAGG